MGASPLVPPAGAEVRAPSVAATREESDAEKPALCPQHLPAHTDVMLMELGQDRKDSGDRQALTNQNEDTDQQRDEGAGAQRG